MSVCLFVSLSAFISKTTRPHFTQFSVHVTCDRAPFFSANNAMRCVLLVYPGYNSYYVLVIVVFSLTCSPMVLTIARALADTL